VTEKKVLIITYYWPPSGGSGVQRWLKLVKYLPQFGCKPYVFTPENPAFAIRDESLLKDVPPEAEVIKLPIWEPYDAFFKMSGWFGRKKSATPTDLVASGGPKSLFQKLSTWVRGNMLIPDPRIFWVRPAARYLHKYLQEHNIPTIITTGPPHSMHLIGRRLKRKNPTLTWIADFRDPWSEWGLLDSLMSGSFARNQHRRLERCVLKEADKVITVTPFYVRQFEQLGQRRVQLLTNGFDTDDFREVQVRPTENFVIRHVGIINEKNNPRPFMLAVKALIEEDAAFQARVRIEFTGEVHPQFRGFVTADPVLSGISLFMGNVPHKELMGLYGQSSLLLVVLTGYKDAEGYLPGKLFEYLATGLPVLGVGPEHGDAAAMLNATGAGAMIDDKNPAAIKAFILNVFRHWQHGGLKAAAGNGHLLYSRRELARSVAAMLEPGVETHK
jgi:glycosyltransferase involved in cell wall biosynthesis